MDIWSQCFLFLEAVWASIVSRMGNEYNIFVWGTIFYSNFVFLVLNIPFVFMDLTGRPNFLMKYKIQEGKNQPLSPGKLWKTLSKIAKYNAFAQLAPIFLYPFMKWRGIEYSAESLPTIQKVLLHLILCGLVEEFLFYYSHRLLHHPYFYKRIHKIHHEWTAPISLSCVYAHPVETLVKRAIPLSNTLPVLTTPVIVGCHYTTGLVWIAIALFWTIKDHSGYHLPFLPPTEFHDYHHLKFNQNYGVFGILDWVHGTNKQYTATVQFDRDRTLFGSKSAKEVVPDRKRKS